MAGVARGEDVFVRLAEDVAAGREFGHVMALMRGTGLRLRKILGKGGQGIVALFEVGDGNGGTKVVIKGPLRDEVKMKRFITREKRNVLVSLLRRRSGRRMILGLDSSPSPTVVELLLRKRKQEIGLVDLGR